MPDNRQTTRKTVKRFDGRRRYAGFVLGAAVWSVAPAAQAQGITNPAKNPFPVTVTIDGQSYSDGRDTLPGYDDELCTPIPNVQYDFAENQILYYSGDGELLKTARWTEWARISSYQTWLDQQNAATPTPTATATPAPTSAPATTAPTTSAPTGSTNTTSTTGPAATNPAAKTPSSKRSSSAKSPSKKNQSTKSPTTKRSTTTSPSTNSQGGSSPAAPSTSKESSSSSPAAKSGTPKAPSTDSSPAPDDAAATAPVADAAPTDSAGAAVPAGTSAPDASGVTPVAGVENATPAPGPATAKKYKLASEQVGVAGGEPNTRVAGIGILASLCAVGFFCLLFREVRHRAFGRR